MRSLSLELLRPGPPHNQLLSPLTHYLALCDNEPAVTLQVPFEHHAMLRYLRALSYQTQAHAREQEMREVARALGDLLRPVKALGARLSERRERGGAAVPAVMHLRLVLSASELALLPFELAHAPKGFPGTGEPLLLQHEQPLCITRETRRVARAPLVWPAQPKVLFAYASPAGFEQVPAGAHLLALRRALEPWLALTEDLDAGERHARLRQRLVVLPRASPTSLRQHMEQGGFTHVHLLAHGAELRTDDDVRYGLALHADEDGSGVEVVDGERLAELLRTPQLRGSDLPPFVTLASCNSANQGGVISAGASLAHALHDAGVSMVVASQFPLSFGASVEMVEVLFEGLLWGRDPRVLLVDLRHRLHARFPHTHDWASLLAYATFPEDFDAQLASTRIQQAMEVINNALDATDRMLARQAQAGAPPVQSSTAALDLVARAKSALLQALEEFPSERSRCQALLGSTCKREAELRFHALPSWARATPAERQPVLDDMYAARRHYWDAYGAQRTDPYALVQFLALSVVLGQLGALGVVDEPASARDLRGLWQLASMQSRLSLQAANVSERAWACANLLELSLIAAEISRLDGDAIEVEEVAALFTASLTDRGFALFSTRRQINRYVRWFSKLDADEAGWGQRMHNAAESLLTLLPRDTQATWQY